MNIILKKFNDIFGAMELHICEITLMQHIRSELTLVLGPRYITLIILHCDLNQCNKITKKKKKHKKVMDPMAMLPQTPL